MPASRLFALTPGEPAGIGPDLCLLLAREAQPQALVAVASRQLLAERAAQLGLHIELHDVGPGNWPDAPAPAGNLYVWDTPLAAPVVAGQLDRSNADYVLQTLTRAGQGCIDGTFAGMITAPVHKGVINEAGIPFSGHTEFLAELTATEQVVMMLATRGLRVALVTTHLPLRDVADAITAERLARVSRILHADLVEKFGIAAPRILVCGLNPHAGEGGHLGREEIEVIEPTLARLRGEGLNLIGPLPADTLFPAKYLEDCGCGTRHVPRPGAARAQIQGLRQFGQYHPWTSFHPHFGGSRHRTGSGRQGPRRLGQPDHRDQPRHQDGREKKI